MTRKRKDTQMLQKTQWSLAATALAVGAFLVAAAQPAHAQVRHHLTGPVKSTTSTGIILPPSSPSSISVTTPPAPTPAPKSTPVVTPTPSTSVSTGQSHTISTLVKPPAPVVKSAPQGFSAGPGLMGENRVNLGHMVDRVAPD